MGNHTGRVLLVVGDLRGRRGEGGSRAEGSQVALLVSAILEDARVWRSEMLACDEGETYTM